MQKKNDIAGLSLLKAAAEAGAAAAAASAAAAAATPLFYMQQQELSLPNLNYHHISAINQHMNRSTNNYLTNRNVMSDELLETLPAAELNKLMISLPRDNSPTNETYKHIISDELLENMPRKKFSEYLKDLPRDEIVKLKKNRRALKMRGYKRKKQAKKRQMLQHYKELQSTPTNKTNEHIISDEVLENMPSEQFNEYLKDLPRDEIVKLKKNRRALKMRGYKRNVRKRLQNYKELEDINQELNNKLKTMEMELNTTRHELNMQRKQFEGINQELNNKLKTMKMELNRTRDELNMLKQRNTIDQNSIYDAHH